MSEHNSVTRLSSECWTLSKRREVEYSREIEYSGETEYSGGIEYTKNCIGGHAGPDFGMGCVEVEEEEDEDEGYGSYGKFVDQLLNGHGLLASDNAVVCPSDKSVEESNVAVKGNVPIFVLRNCLARTPIDFHFRLS